jgi:OmpA-like transmembrane domain
MKIVLMAMLTGLMSCTSAYADSLILGGNFGIATGGENAASLNNQLRDKGFTATATTSGDIRTAWQTYITYQFQPRWGIELAYVDLGAATITFSGIENPIDEILDGIGENQPRSAQGVKLSITRRFELNKGLQLQSKLGAYNWQTSYAFSGVNVDGDLVRRDVNLSGTNISFGLGLVHKLTNNISAHLDWDFYSIDGEVINMFAFGASYLFE